MKALKKLAWIVGGLLGLLLLAAISLPLFVDVDRYRPQIVEKANSLIDGKLELGKLSLSLWGKIQIAASGLELSDSKGRKVVSVQDASFILPFSSILGGAPKLTLAMKSPQLSVVRDASGEINALGLMKKTTPAAAAAPSTPGEEQKAAPAPTVALPAFVAQARLGVEIVDGRLQYRDEQKKFESTINKLQVKLKNASITRPTELEVEAEMDTQVGESIQVKGPLKLMVNTQPVISGAALQQMGIELLAQASDLDISMQGLFHKPKGIPVELKGKLVLGTNDARIESLIARFHNAELTLAGVIEKLATDPQTSMKLSSNAIELQEWSKLVPMLEPYRLAGKVDLQFEVNGPVSAIRYGGKVGVHSMKFTHPRFKADPQWDGELVVGTDQLEKLDFRMKAPGSEMQIQGKLAHFMKPQFSIQVNSSAMDLDQWVDFSVPKKNQAADAAKKTAETSGQAAVPSTDFDALLDPVRKNPIALAAGGQLMIDIRKLKAYQAPLSEVRAKASLAALALQLESASFKAFEGQVSATAKMDLKPAHPSYSFSGKVSGVQIQKAVESQMSFLKDTLLGRLQAEASGSGTGFNPTAAIQALNMKGSFEVKQARFATIDIVKLAADGINGAISKAAEKVPALQGRKLGTPGGKDSSYEFIRSDFQMVGGKFSAPHFMAKSDPGKGIDLQGSLMVDLKDQGLQMKMELIDTHNITKAQDVSAEVAGVQIPHVLAEKGKPVRIPLSLGCKLTQPCPSYTELPEHFARVALSNLSGAAQDKLKSEAKSKLGEVLKGAPLPGGLKKFLR